MKFGKHKQRNKIDLSYLYTLELRNICTFLLGEAATLSVGDFIALSSGNSLAFFLLDSFALPLLDLSAFFLGNVFTLLGPDVSTHLLVVDLLTDLLSHRVALLTVDSLTLATRNILTHLKNIK